MPTGEVTIIPKEEVCDVEWKMNFASFSKKVDAIFCSPNFYFEGESWFLVISPNGGKSAGYIGLRVWKHFSNSPPINVEFSFSIKTVNNNKDSTKRNAGVFEGSSCRHDIDRFLLKSDFEKRQSEFLSSGFLTVVCTLKRLNTSQRASDIAPKECSHCNRTFAAEEISSHEKKCRVKCPECLDVVLLKNWQDHECDKSRTEALEKLSDDLKGVMMSGDNSDTIIKVKREEFRLHRNILRARSPYFNSMFNSNMSETNTGVVCIDDCEPGVFRSFIHFLYTGKVDKLSPENVCDVYEISDKYQEDQLKEECLLFMMNSITVDSLCDFIIVAMRHEEGDSEKKLLLKAAQYFASNTKEIIRSGKWLAFLEEYPDCAIALHSKAFDEEKTRNSISKYFLKTA